MKISLTYGDDDTVWNVTVDGELVAENVTREEADAAARKAAGLDAE